jgi:hypothetical protein
MRAARAEAGARGAGRGARGAGRGARRTQRRRPSSAAAAGRHAAAPRAPPPSRASNNPPQAVPLVASRRWGGPVDRRWEIALARVRASRVANRALVGGAELGKEGEEILPQPLAIDVVDAAQASTYTAADARRSVGGGARRTVKIAWGKRAHRNQQGRGIAYTAQL